MTETSNNPQREYPLHIAANCDNTIKIQNIISIASSFAFEQLYIVTSQDSAPIFMASMMKIFGLDIPPKAYDKLYQDILNKEGILKAKIKLTPSLPKNGLAAFRSSTQEIYITEGFANRALTNNDKAGELMIALVEEYGHFLDHRLRYHYSNIQGDAEKDEGAKFSYQILTINALDESSQIFGEVIIKGENNPNPLIWDYSPLHAALAEHVNSDRKNTEDKGGDYEFFKAGKLKPHGHYGHGNIEENALKPAYKYYLSSSKVTKVIDTIYLGNWLRDFSQAIDPMIIRPMSTAIKSAADTAPSGGFLNKINPFAQAFKPLYDAAKLHPIMLSVEAVTSAIELAAAKEFVHAKEKNGKNIENYDSYLKVLREDYIEITKDTLGPYRPEEHIDNPKGLGQNSRKGNRGDKSIYNKFVGYVSDYNDIHKIDRTYGVKNYIRSKNKNFRIDGDNLKTSFEYIAGKLRAAGKKGGFNKNKCLVDFGAALHTLEDYFAHTNFSEISLIKSVEPLVFPWVDKVKETGFSYSYEELFKNDFLDDKYIIFNDKNKAKSLTGKHRLAAYIPVVTGTFGAVDTAASVLPVLNEHLFSIEIKPWEKSSPNERTFTDILFREILKDIDNLQQEGVKSNYSDNFEILLNTRDTIKEWVDKLTPDLAQAAFHWITERIRVLISFSLFIILKKMGTTLNDAQLALGKDLKGFEDGIFSIGVDPSHTQIAKDDPHQPTHTLAVELATIAVNRIAKTMTKVWIDGDNVENVISELKDIMRHPAETDWQDKAVISWAKKNEKSLCRAISPSVLIDGLFHQQEEIKKIIKDMKENIPKVSTEILTTINSYFGSDDSGQSISYSIEKALEKAEEIYNEQTKKIEELAVIWSKKFAKPSICGKYCQHRHGNHLHSHFNTKNSTALYLVTPQDNLWEIAKKHNTTVNDLKAINKLESDLIHPGDYLKVPNI